MKLLAAVSLVLITGLAHASDWRKIVDCDDDSTVIDTRYEEWSSSTVYQIVIRDSRAVEYLISTSAVF